MIKGLGILLVYAFWFWRGYQRRRGVWSAASWRRFGALIAAGVVVEVIGISMAIGVDHGVYASLSPVWDRVYFYTLMTLAVVGPALLAGLVFWFALGRPDRQLGQGRASAQ